MTSQQPCSPVSQKKSRDLNWSGNCKEITGTFMVPYNNSVVHAGNESSDDDEAEESESFLDYRDMHSGDNMVRARLPSEKRVELKDKAGSKHICHGRFSMTETYWEVTVRMNKIFLRSAPVYSLRTDLDVVRTKNMVAIFLSDCLQVCKDATKQNGTQACFEHYCRTMGFKDDLTFAELDKVLTHYIEQEKSQDCFLGKSPNRGFGNLSVEDHSKYMTDYVLESDLGASVLAAASLPHLVRTLSSLFPYAFSQILNKLSKNSKQQRHQKDAGGKKDGSGHGENDGGDKNSENLNQQRNMLVLADAMARVSPWEFCFREIVKKKLRLYGLEASLKAYLDSGLLSCTPLTPRDALYVYEVMKTDAKRDGHIYIPFRVLRGHHCFRKLDYQIHGLERWKLALDYLETNGVTKTEEFGGDINIFLHQNWQAEVDTTEAVRLILDRHRSEPLDWDVDLFSSEFSNIRCDSDQLKACLLICSTPIVVMSGRGGCGKTTVITSLLKHLCNREKKRIEDEEKKRHEERILERQQSFTTMEYVDQKVSNEQTLAQERIPTCLGRSFVKSSLSSVETRNPFSLCLDMPLSGLSLSAQPVKQEPLTLTCGEQHQRLYETSSTLTSAPDKDSTENLTHLMLGKAKTTNVLKTEVPSHSHRRQTKMEILKKELVCDLLKILLSKSSNSDDSALDDYKRKMLLTAPTGKAARLLGCKAGLPSATLHSVLASWQAFISQKLVQGEWKYADVEVLVVDECSLVSMRLFSNVAKILLERANLRKVVLLGDIRQLPSIEPGNFLKDMFKTLSCISVESDSNIGTSVAGSGLGLFNLAIELSHNHRSESQLIVSNSELISCMKTPTFDSRRNFHLVKADLRGGDNERDVAIRHLLQTAPDLNSHVNSQFVAFRNAHCLAVNELCCHFYNDHSIKQPSRSGKKEKFDFRVGDKVCLTKNNQVSSFHAVYLDQYRTEFPELQEALSREECRLKEKMKEKAEREECGKKESSREVDVETVKPQDQSAVEGKRQDLSKVGFGANDIPDLLDQNDVTFDTTIAEMKEREETQRKKEERIQRARQKQHSWKTKSEKKLLRNAVASSLGKSSEKLCNGEVFFIMDEFDHFEEKSNSRHQSDGVAHPTKYFLLSDRDPDMPRVVCVPFRELRKLCRMRHSWARTIHTYQGSESTTVVYVLGPAMPQTWQHVYTAVTRGRKSVYVLGDWDQLHKAINRRDIPRRTHLSHRLQKSLKDQAACLGMCHQEFIKRQKPYWDVINALDRGDSPGADRSGDEFGSDDSWLIQAISQEEQASINEIPDGDVEEEDQMISREAAAANHLKKSDKSMGTNLNLLTDPSRQREACNSSQSESCKSNQDPEFGEDWWYISSSSQSEEEESIFAPLHKFREKQPGNTIMQDVTSKAVEEGNKVEEDEDYFRITQTQFIEKNLNTETQSELDESLFEHDDSTLVEEISIPELEKTLTKMNHNKTTSDQLSELKGCQGAETCDPVIPSSYQVGYNRGRPVVSAVQINNISLGSTPEKNLSVNGNYFCSKTSPKPVPVPQSKEGSPSNQRISTAGKRMYDASCNSAIGLWDVSVEVSPTKLQRTSNVVGSPLLKSFSDSLTLDHETKMDSSGREQEESPFPVRRKLNKM